MDKYPLLHPDIHLNDLSNELSVLTNYKNNQTKKLNKYHRMIIRKCTGTNSIQDIKAQLSTSYEGQAIVKQVDEYIHTMISWGYLTWSPHKVSNLNSPIHFFKDHPTNHQGLTPTSMIAITISILDSCCLKCDYCSQNAPNGKSIYMSLQKIKELLDDAYELGARYFGVFGGEPMMHPNIYEIISYAYEKGYKRVQLFTRATLIGEEAARKLHAAGIHSLQLTVDSHIPDKYDDMVGVKGSFARMYRGVYCLLSYGIEISLKIIVTRQNVHDIPDMVVFFRELGIQKFDIEVVVPVGRAGYDLVPSLDQIHSLQQKLDQIKTEYVVKQCSLSYLKYGRPKQCGGGINSIMVFADGDTGPCDKSYFIKDKVGFGNIYEHSLKEIWFGDGPSFFRKLRNDDPRCRSCAVADSCLGGCILNAYIQNGSAGPDPMCVNISGKTEGVFPIEV